MFREGGVVAAGEFLVGIIGVEGGEIDAVVFVSAELGDVDLVGLEDGGDDFFTEDGLLDD